MTDGDYSDKLVIMSRAAYIPFSVILAAIAVWVVLALPAYAQDTATSAATAPVKKDRIQAVKERQQVAQQRIEAKKENIQAKVAATKERIASKAAALKTRLQSFRDQKKAEIADRLNTNLNNVNQKQTSQMQRHLDSMSLILNKLEARVNSGKPDIKDQTSTQTAIDAARADITAAVEAVSAQSLKDYTITVTSEGRIGLDAKSQRDALHKDLESTRKTVREAKKSVSDAIRIAKSGSVSSADKAKEASVSGQ